MPTHSLSKLTSILALPTSEVNGLKVFAPSVTIPITPYVLPQAISSFFILGLPGFNLVCAIVLSTFNKGDKKD